jgi:hypothetical protein
MGKNHILQKRISLEGFRMVNIDLKIAFIRTFGSQTVASRRLKIAEDKISHFVQGHNLPNERERKILKEALGVDYFVEKGELENGEKAHAAIEKRANVKRGVTDILVSETGSVLGLRGTAEKDSK